jgi:8-oxo-dGTP pyrophosphatase MutT (NUDIX family)
MPTEEMFDVLDGLGNKTGRILGRREVHHRGLRHMGMNLCVTDGRGNVYQQLRGGPPDVRNLPDVWDVFLVAGHSAAGETPLDTLLRETWEEVGLRFTLDQLRANGLQKVSVTQSDYWVKDPSFPAGGYQHRLFDHNFVVRITDLDLAVLTLEPKKVLYVRLYSIEAMQRELAQPASSQDYRRYAHRPPQDEILYGTVLNGALALTL